MRAWTATESTFRLGLANGIASFVVAFMAPLIGAIADKGRARVRLLGLFTALGALLTAAFYFVGKGDWSSAAILYIGASLGFWGGNQFYDSLLTDVAEESEYDLVSGYGFALGYLGGGAAVCRERGHGHASGLVRPRQRHRGGADGRS